MAASIPSSTRATGKSIPFIAPKTASSSESRLTVTRCRPAAASGPASARSAEPFVVRVRSISPPSGRRIAASIAMRSRQVAPDERLAAGDPQLLDAERHERPRRPLDLLEGQDLVARQERVVLPEDLLGHAIGAPEVAPVGDRDAQVAHRPTERVGRSGPAVEGRRGIHRAHGSRGTACGRPAVPPAQTTGTSSQLHRTDPRCHDAPKPRMSGRPLPTSRMRIATHGSDRHATGLQASLDGRAWS